MDIGPERGICQKGKREWRWDDCQASKDRREVDDGGRAGTGGYKWLGRKRTRVGSGGGSCAARCCGIAEVSHIHRPARAVPRRARNAGPARRGRGTMTTAWRARTHRPRVRGWTPSAGASAAPVGFCPWRIVFDRVSHATPPPPAPLGVRFPGGSTRPSPPTTPPPISGKYAYPIAPSRSLSRSP